MSTSVSAESSPPVKPDDDKLDRGTLIIAGVVVLGAIMSILDITVVSVALETFKRDFDATEAEVAWTMTGYTLALASVIPLTGWAADRFGTKRLYLLAVVLFTLGSVLCAMADTLNQLVLYRVIQGLGGGMLMPLGMTILTRAAGPHRVGRVMAVMGIPMLLGPIFGPIVGGWLIDVASWHWIFLINLPIGVIAIVYAAMALPKDHVEPSESFDWLGMLLLSPGLAGFLYGVSSIPEHGTVWHSKVLVPAIIGLLLIAAFVPWALNRRNEHPLVDLRLFANPRMTVAVIAMMTFGIAFFGSSLLFPMYFQGVRGETALSSGLILAPQGIGAMLTMPLAGVMADRKGPGQVVLIGITLTGLGMAGFIGLGSETSYWWLLSSLFVMGLGMGMTMMPIMSAALSTLTNHNIARGSTLTNISQQVASSIGAAVFSVILTNRMQSNESVELAEELEAADIGKEQIATGAPEFVQFLQDRGLSPERFQSLMADVPGDMATSFGTVFVVATILIAACLIPAWFLPRKPPETPVDPTALVGH